ncbi:outer membrane protein assembly factor BamE [Vreelandella sp. 2A-K22]
MQPKHHREMTSPAGVAGLVIMLALTGCATGTSSDRGADGDVRFPEIDAAWQEKGNFVNVDNLRQMRPGVSKDQIYALLGRPHFQEGLFDVREWNYILHFRTGEAPDDYVTCQYQVQFDDAMLAESLHWRDPACATYLEAQ